MRIIPHGFVVVYSWVVLFPNFGNFFEIGALLALRKKIRYRLHSLQLRLTDFPDFKHRVYAVKSVHFDEVSRVNAPKV